MADRRFPIQVRLQTAIVCVGLTLPLQAGDLEPKAPPSNATSTYCFSFTRQFPDARVGNYYEDWFYGSPQCCYPEYGPRSWCEGNVPPGLSCGGGHYARISGVPTTLGTYVFYIKTELTYGPYSGIHCMTAEATLVVTDCPFLAVHPSTIPDPQMNQPYAQRLTALGGVPPYSFSLQSGQLPPGLSLSTSGWIQGVPTTAGSYSFSVWATDAEGCRQAAWYSVDVELTCPNLGLDPSVFPRGAVGQDYSVMLGGLGGIPPYSFQVTQGQLPPGLTLASVPGRIQGRPSAVGTATFGITITDGNTCQTQVLSELRVEAGPGLLAGEPFAQPRPNRFVGLTTAGSPTSTDVLAYGAGHWGVEVAAGDLNDDHQAEITTGPGPGPSLGPQVRGFMASGSSIARINYFAYGTLRHGVEVHPSDVDADPFDEILTGAGRGRSFGPHVRGWNFDAASVAPLPGLNYFAYSTLAWGVNVASGNVESPDPAILTGAGPGQVFQPHARGWSYTTRVAAIPSVSFIAYAALRYGVDLSGGDADADLVAEIATAPGPGPDTSYTSRLLGFEASGAGIAPVPGFDVTPFASFYGARLALGWVNANPRVDLVAGPGPDPAAPASMTAWELGGFGMVKLSFTAVPLAGPYGVNVATGALGY